MAIRISIITSDGGNFSSGSKNRQLQLRNNEVSFRQYNFFDFNGVTYLVGSLASANICPTGFAKSLILSTSLVARLIMKKLSIPVLQASIGDDSVTHNGSLGWTEQMARRLGYEQSTDYSNLFVYTYD